MCLDYLNISTFPITALFGLTKLSNKFTPTTVKWPAKHSWNLILQRGQSFPNSAAESLCVPMTIAFLYSTHHSRIRLQGLRQSKVYNDIGNIGWLLLRYFANLKYNCLANSLAHLNRYPQNEEPRRTLANPSATSVCLIASGQ